MKMTPLNIGLFVGALLLGVALYFVVPSLGLLLFPLLVVFVVVILLRNKSGEKADPAQTAEAMTMMPAEGKARIYVMRKGFVGGQQGMNITINDDLNSQIRTKYFLMAEVEPGTHTVTAQMSSGTKGSARSHEITLEANKSVLLDMKLQMGAVQGKPDFTEVRDMVEAKSMLNGLKLVLWK
ncbi:DUF2846 domain-containing protein [Alterisphingorhabdus coralli]|uniref:DUF2846 domain-containing protein n=1 Tax=Alterisphingorhabdus coralli TaxID=3071408 RepID=A0AA97F4B7_9SPHN|nr:DUF2846 domain-containing protein [Parasphingorhabdus sp. SCSIO 66989]WOE74064.1 hypothetical protein RB602_09345 [Parasphingorhabdus sp. SCSIO 66989]